METNNHSQLFTLNVNLERTLNQSPNFFLDCVSKTTAPYSHNKEKMKTA